MDRSKERNFNKSVQAWIKKYGHVTNHEDKWTPGVADISWAVQGFEGWIELKVQPQPVDFALKWQYLLRPYQLPWLCDRERHGGDVWVMYQMITRGRDYRGVPTSTNSLCYVAFKPFWLKEREDKGDTLFKLLKTEEKNRFITDDFDTMMKRLITKS